MELSQTATSTTRTSKRLPRPDNSPALTARTSQRQWFLGPASGALLFLSFPPANRPDTAWVALVPLFLLTSQAFRTLTACLSAWAGGVLFWAASLVWMWELHPSAWLAWLALALYQSVYWVAVIALVRVARGALHIPLIVAAPVVWIASEYVQAFALSGFPWYYLAHSQHAVLPLIQVSDIVGAWGVSFVIALVNAGIAAILESLWRLRGERDQAGTTRTPLSRGVWVSLLCAVLAPIGVLGGVLGYGHYQLANSGFTPGPRVLLLQSNLRQAMKMNLDADKIVGMFADLIRSAYARDAKEGVDLVVWPETSYPTGWITIDPKASLNELDTAARQIQAESTVLGWINRRTEATQELNLWSRELGCPMVVGLPTYTLTPNGGYKANGAAWIDGATQPPAMYHKMHLVPFGEYIPLMEVFPWIKRLAPYDDSRVPRLKAGERPVWFDSGSLRYATAICFEDTVPHLVRRFFKEAPDARQPDALINMSNDGWFNGSAEHEMHLAIGIFRSVENRAPLIRVANMGYTAVVDGNGKVVKSLPKKTADTLTATVPLDPRESVYTHIGDLFPQTCLILTGTATAVAGVRRRGVLRVENSQTA